MTFAALSTIHSILENEKYKAEKVLEVSRYNFNEELDQKAEELGSTAKAHKAMIGRAVTTRYEDAKRDLNKIIQALEEFDAQDWRQNTMIKLYFLEWENGLVKAGFTFNGKRYISLVTSQNSARFVRSGDARTHNLTRHQLSEAQNAAVEAFTTSNDFAVEYPAPIL